MILLELKTTLFHDNCRTRTTQRRIHVAEALCDQDSLRYGKVSVLAGHTGFTRRSLGSPRHAVVHEAVVAEAVAAEAVVAEAVVAEAVVAAAAVLMQEGHHGIRVAVVQRRGRSAAGWRARHRRQAAQHHRLLLLADEAVLRLLLLVLRQAVAADGWLPVEAAEALVEATLVEEMVGHR